MEKFIIHFGGKDLHPFQFVQIHLCRWYLVPLHGLYSNTGDPPQPNNYVYIYTPGEKTKSLDIEECRVMFAKTHYRVERLFRFLCFSITYTRVLKTEIADIYGTNYKKDNDTLEGAKDKYKRLIDSGYFN